MQCGHRSDGTSRHCRWGGLKKGEKNPVAGKRSKVTVGSAVDPLTNYSSWGYAELQI